MQDWRQTYPPPWLPEDLIASTAFQTHEPPPGTRTRRKCIRRSMGNASRRRIIRKVSGSVGGRRLLVRPAIFSHPALLFNGRFDCIQCRLVFGTPCTPLHRSHVPQICHSHGCAANRQHSRPGSQEGKIHTNGIFRQEIHLQTHILTLQSHPVGEGCARHGQDRAQLASQGL